MRAISVPAVSSSYLGRRVRSSPRLNPELAAASKARLYRIGYLSTPNRVADAPDAVIVRNRELSRYGRWSRKPLTKLDYESRSSHKS